MNNFKKISAVTAFILTAVVSTGCGGQGIDKFSGNESESSSVVVDESSTGTENNDTENENTSEEGENNSSEENETASSEENETASSDEVITDEEENVIKFRTGTWASSSGDNYVFEADGNTGKVLHPSLGTGLPFDYTLTGTDAVFYMGGTEFESVASVSFSEDGNSVNLLWSDGLTETLSFISDRTDDEFSLGEKKDEIDTSYIHFQKGTWQSSSGQNYVFYEDGKGGKICNPSTGGGIPFDYEADDCSYIFHLGGVENESYASVTFNSDTQANIVWSYGAEELLNFMSDNTDDTTAYTNFFQ